MTFPEHTKKTNHLFIQRIQGHIAPCSCPIPYLRFKTVNKIIIYIQYTKQINYFLRVCARMKSSIILQSYKTARVLLTTCSSVMSGYWTNPIPATVLSLLRLVKFVRQRGFRNVYLIIQLSLQLSPSIIIDTEMFEYLEHAWIL